MEKIWQKSYGKGVPYSIRFEDITLPEALTRTAARFGERVAIGFQGTDITFRQFDQMVSRFAAALRRLHVKPGQKVSLILPNLIQTAVGIYGALRAGAVAVTHNPRLDDMMLEYQLNTAASEVVLCLDVLVPRILNLKSRTALRQVISCHIRDYLPFLKKQLFPLVKKELHLNTSGDAGVLEFTDLMEKNEPEKSLHRGHMEDTAFILFTSATTGKPKGVELTHANMTRNVQQVRTWFPSFRDGQETVVGCLPFFHVFGLTCALNISVFYGYTNVLVPLPEPKNILEALDQYQATFIPALPTFYTGMMNEPSLKKFSLKSLRGCFCGGAPLALETIRSFEKLTGAQICEGYGLTESSPVSLINPLGGKTKVGTIGLPLPNTDVKLLDVDDPQIEITVPGEPGELCVKGPQVMKGYVNMPEQTEATLKDGWLLTGDIAVFDSDGYFSIVDRKKEMIITVDGKIYPRDVDEVLFTHPKIMEACAIGVPDRAQGQIVKAYVVTKKGETPTAGEIIEHCKRHLPANKVPKQIEFLKELPRSPVGKILRKELRRMHLVQSALSTVKSGAN
ncbi:MAG: long-chain fatty acid--CoA ligase [Desulfomonile tiedjei]|uniref:Long-chain fatty acid--CoA ligase n=1 Tax=Desulfomonile tiedjei TaxID=2358 RepID=A0A9D6V207_9BACT|nr:long-chain fatty acid--CoA ligase [Desulfomonile tiedjei]